MQKRSRKSPSGGCACSNPRGRELVRSGLAPVRRSPVSFAEVSFDVSSGLVEAQRLALELHEVRVNGATDDCGNWSVGFLEVWRFGVSEECVRKRSFPNVKVKVWRGGALCEQNWMLQWADLWRWRCPGGGGEGAGERWRAW